MTAPDRTDAQLRRLARVTDERISLVAGAAAREGLLEGILDMPVPSESGGRRRLRPAVVAGVTALALGASGAIGYAMFSSARDTTSIECVLGADDSLIIPSASGDPVADCAAEWRRVTGAEPPPLRAYDNGRGGIAVADARLPLPEGATPLEPGATQNVALVELEQSLHDVVAGLQSRCHDPATAEQFAGRELARLGLSGWRVDRGEMEGSCVDGAVLDPAQRKVTLRGFGTRFDQDQPYARLAAKLRTVTAQCLPLEAATARVHAAAREAGLSPGHYNVTAVPTETGCTRIHETVGGSVFVTLRGPKA